MRHPNVEPYCAHDRFGKRLAHAKLDLGENFAQRLYVNGTVTIGNILNILLHQVVTGRQ